MEWSGTSGAKERGEGRDLRPEHRGEGRSERAKGVIGRVGGEARDLRAEQSGKRVAEEISDIRPA